MKKNKFMIIVGAVFVGNIALDIITKIIAKALLQDKERISLFFDTLRIEYAENTGAFLSMGAQWPQTVKYLVLLILPLLVCAWGLWYIIFREKDIVQAILLACIIGGGVGNLLSRLFNNFTVVDFLNFGIGPVFRTGIVNLADISVTFGLLFLIIYEIMQRKQASTK